MLNRIQIRMSYYESRGPNSFSSQSKFSRNFMINPVSSLFTKIKNVSCKLRGQRETIFELYIKNTSTKQLMINKIETDLPKEVSEIKPAIPAIKNTPLDHDESISVLFTFQKAPSAAVGLPGSEKSFFLWNRKDQFFFLRPK